MRGLLKDIRVMSYKPAGKHCNGVILSDAKNLAFSCCDEILHGACPELNYETLRFTQGDGRRVQYDHCNCGVNNECIRKNTLNTLPLISSPQGKGKNKSRGTRKNGSPLPWRERARVRGSCFAHELINKWNLPRLLVESIIVLAFVFLFTGCAVGPDYVRPVVDVPADFRYQDKEAREAANLEWWRQFNDPVLDGLIIEALANNRSIKIAAANVEQASGVMSQARSPLFPQFGYDGSGARQRATESGATPLPSSVPNPQTSYQALSSVSWEIDLWGRIRRLSESAQAQLFATEEAWRGVILSLVASVASDYIQLLGLDEQLAISKRSLAVYAESVRLFELQFKYGQVSQMNVEQARTQYETAAAAVPQIESQIAQTENALSILLGRNPGTITRGKTTRELMLPPVPAGLPADVLANRPDVRQAEQNLIAANAQIGAARALYFPTISLTGAFGYASSDLSNLFKGPSRTWSYAGSFAGPVFTGGAISGQVRQAEAGRKAALSNYELTVQNAFADVENALATYRKLIDQIHAQERLVRAGSEYERLARLQYNGGYSPYSTVLQAEQQLFPSELNYAQYRAQLFISLVNIYKAMGGGWIVEAENLTVQKDK